MKQRYKYVILGGGFTGLSVAGLLGDEDYIVFEKDAVPGGYCRSIRSNGYIWDYAGHFFHFADPDNKRFFEKAFGNDVVVRKKNTKIYYKGDYIDYPFQCNIHQLPRDEFVDCLYDLYYRDASGGDRSFKDMVYGNFGRSIADKFLVPYNEKLYACDLNTLDSKAMGRFFPYASFEDVLRNIKQADYRTYNDTFIYPVNGAQTAIDYLLSLTDPGRIALNSEITAIDLLEKKVFLGEEGVAYEHLISTIPLNAFLKLSGDPWRGITDRLSYNKVLVLNLGFDLPNDSVDYHWVYVPDKKINFYRVGFYNNILGTDPLSLYIEIGFPKDARIDVPLEQERAMEHLRQMGIIDRHRLAASHAVVMDPAYVHISQETERELGGVFSALAERQVYCLGRYGMWTYCSMEDCFDQAKTLVRSLAGTE